MADHRLSRKPSEIAAVLGGIVAELAILLPNRVASSIANALGSLRAEREAKHPSRHRARSSASPRVVGHHRG